MKCHHQPPFFFFLACGFLLGAFAALAPVLPFAAAAAAAGVGVEALPEGGGEAAAGEAALGIAPEKRIKRIFLVPKINISRQKCI